MFRSILLLLALGLSTFAVGRVLDSSQLQGYGIAFTFPPMNPQPNCTGTIYYVNDNQNIVSRLVMLCELQLPGQQDFLVDYDFFSATPADFNGVAKAYLSTKMDGMSCNPYGNDCTFVGGPIPLNGTCMRWNPNDSNGDFSTLCYLTDPLQSIIQQEVTIDSQNFPSWMWWAYVNLDGTTVATFTTTSCSNSVPADVFVTPQCCQSSTR